MISAITFDFWNTLVHEPPGLLRSMRVDAWGEVLERAGRPIERMVLEAMLDESWRTFNQAWQDGQQYVAADAARWLIANLQLDELPAAVQDELVHEFATVGERAPLELTSNVAEALRALDEAGLRIGIICDVGMTGSPILRRHLQRLGVLDHFDHWSFSDEVGAYKPDRRIFEHALGGLGVEDPSTVAHIGDLRRTDVAGALAMGMTALRYTGVFDDPGEHGAPEADVVIADHAALPGVVLPTA